MKQEEMMRLGKERGGGAADPERKEGKGIERFWRGHAIDPNANFASPRAVGGKPCGESVESEQSPDYTCVLHGIG